MSSRDAEERLDALPLKARLEAYYGRYYGDVLGIPGWRDLVAVRLDDTAYEGERLARLERAVGRHVAGARLLNVGCGTGGFNEVARGAGVDAWGLDAAAEATTIATLRPLTLAECRALVEAAGARVTRVLEGGVNRPVGGPLWPLVRAYYRLFGVRPYIELVATRREAL